MAQISRKITRPIVKYRGGALTPDTDEIASEYPLTIYVNDDEFATIVCTPADWEELVVGFLATEGVIAARDEIKDLSFDLDNGFAYAELHRKSAIDPALFSKRRIASCCGKSRQSFYLLSDAKTAHPVASRLAVQAEACLELMERLHVASGMHQETGGVHNAALFSPEEAICIYSDIGRHNALDKIHGYCLMRGIATADTILAFSGRLSSEVVLKAAKIGAPVLLSKSAPTDLALQLAEELGLTAAGFIRGGRMNIYTHDWRIIAP